ncbi:MAG: DUF1858 domain-containing protein [Oscillospiraceae bacterium]|nr:DUF1858 domain-containing protein [Oscillospiraceae bacterium]
MITRDMVIGDLLDENAAAKSIFLESGMHCLGCPAARGETIEEACAVHGVDCDLLLKKLNAASKQPGCPNIQNGL